MSKIKRLWLRSINSEWIQVPYGAGEDLHVRSFNVRDKKNRWLTPTPYEFIDNDLNHARNHDPSLHVRAPGSTWPNIHTNTVDAGVYNPNLTVSGQPRTPEFKDWVRMFYMYPRVDPNWRIVTTGASYPPFGWGRHLAGGPMNPAFATLGGKLMENDNYQYAAGTSQNYRQAYIWGTIDPNTNNTYNEGNPDVGFPGFFTMGNSVDFFRTFAHQWRFRAAYYSVPTGTTVTTDGVETISGLVDSTVIGNQLLTAWPEGFNLHQYNPIGGMQLKRVIVRATVEMSLTFGESGVDFGTPGSVTIPDAPDQTALFDQYRFRLYSAIDAPSAQAPMYAFSPAYPTITTPFGPIIFEQNGLSTFTVPGRLATRRRKVALTKVYDNPGFFGNIYFATAVDCPAPGLSSATYVQRQGADAHVSATQVGPYPSDWTAQGTLYSVSAEYHYATPGHDTPNNTHVSDTVTQLSL